MSVLFTRARRHLPIFALTLVVFATLTVFLIVWPR